MKKLGSIFLAAVFLLVTFVPVSAGEWDLYGSARVGTFYTDLDEADTTRFTHDLQGNARIGANVKTGNVGGRFEYGTGGGNANIRLLYGTVDLGFGELLAGQHYTPFGIGSFISTQVYGTDNGLLEFVPYSGRQPLVQLSVEGLKIALVKPFQATYPVPFVFDEDDEIPADIAAVLAPLLRTTTTGNPEVLLPQLQLSYDIRMDGVAVNLAGAFQTYDLNDGDGDTLTAWGAGANVRLTMMDPLYLNVGGFYGQNVGNFGQAWGSRLSRADITDPDDIEDANTYAGAVVLGAKLDTIGVEAGVGFRNDELGDVDEDIMAYYLQATVPLSQDGRARIIPEVGMYDYENEDLLYFGLQWRIDF